MNKVIAVVFENEKDTYNALSALKELDQEGSITVYADAVVVKDSDGKIVTEDYDDQESGANTVLGMAMGGFIGLLGGPAGFFLGSYAGMFSGMMFDMHNADVDADFVDDISQKMVPGTMALLADIDEEWTTPLDTKMEENNGVIFRRLRSGAEDGQLSSEVDLAVKDLNHLKEKEASSKRIEKAKKKIIALLERVTEKQKNLNKEFEERSKKLNVQLNKASEENKAKINVMISELSANHDTRLNKLKDIQETAQAGLV